MTKQGKAWKILTGAGVALVLMALGLVAWFSFGKLTPAKLEALKILPYPLALVNGRPIFMQAYLENLRWAEIYNQRQNKPLDSLNLQQMVFNQVLLKEKIKQLAASLNITVSPEQLNGEYGHFQQDFNRQNSAPLTQTLPVYGLSPRQFQEEILKPEVLLNKLAIWHNEQRELNQDSYQTLDQVQQSLRAGESFNSVAAKYTQDPSGKLTEGDLGFMESTDLLPELKTQIEQMNVGETKLLISRLGLHLIKLEEKASSPQAGSSRLHLRQIFIKPADFASWYQKKIDTFSVKMLVKI